MKLPANVLPWFQSLAPCGRPKVVMLCLSALGGGRFIISHYCFSCCSFRLVWIWLWHGNLKGKHNLSLVYVRSDHRWFIYDITCDKPMIFYPDTEINVINTDTNAAFGKNVDNINVFKVNDRELIFILMSLFSLFKKLSQYSWFCFSGTKVMPVFSNTWTLHAEGCVNLWPMTTEQHESHSWRTETRFINAW